MRFKSCLKKGYAGLKTRSVGQILEKKTCVHSRWHSFESVFIKLCQNVYLYEIYVRLKTGSCRVKILIIRSSLRKKHVYTLEGTDMKPPS